MTIFQTLAVAAAIGALGTAAAAQYNPYSNQPGYPYPAYPGQPYPGQPVYPQQQYPQTYPGYGYNQGYGYGQNSVGTIIDQLLGNRYNVTDRAAVSRCAGAVMAQAQSQYGRGYSGYRGQGYGGLRITAITDVERRSNGLRVRGLLDSGYGGYRGQPGYANQGYGDLTFRCNVDYRGYVSNVRIGRNDSYRRY